MASGGEGSARHGELLKFNVLNSATFQIRGARMLWF